MLIYSGHGSDEKYSVTQELHEQKSLANISLHNMKEINCRKNEYKYMVFAILNHDEKPQ